MSTQRALTLPSLPPSNTVVINPRCSLRIEADQRVIVVAGLPMHHYRVEDAVAEAYAMVFLVESGFAQQTCSIAENLQRATLTSDQRQDGSRGWSSPAKRRISRRGVALPGCSSRSVRPDPTECSPLAVHMQRGHATP